VRLHHYYSLANQPKRIGPIVSLGHLTLSLVNSFLLLNLPTLPCKMAKGSEPFASIAMSSEVVAYPPPPKYPGLDQPDRPLLPKYFFAKKWVLITALSMYILGLLSFLPFVDNFAEYMLEKAHNEKNKYTAIDPIYKPTEEEKVCRFNLI